MSNPGNYGWTDPSTPPPPPPRQKKTYGWRNALWAIMLVILVGGLISVCSNPDAAQQGMGAGAGVPSTSAAPVVIPPVTQAPAAIVPAPVAPPAPPAVVAPSGLAAGATSNVDGLQITASAIRREKNALDDRLLCTDVKYVNSSGEKVDYNGLFDWNLQDPDSVIVMPAMFGGERSLSSGELAVGGKVAGSVCFEDPGLKGTYTIINEEMIALNPTKTEWTSEVK